VRIEFNAGTLNSMSVSVFQLEAERFADGIDSVKNGFENVKKNIYNMNGGIGILQDVVNLVKKRVDTEEKKADNVRECEEASKEFLKSVLDTDKSVAKMVTKNKNNFYKQYPHLKPPEPKKEGLLKKALGWLKKAAGKVWDWTKDKAGKVWNWVKEKGSQLLDIMSEVGSKVVAWFVEKGKDIIEGAKQFISSIIDGFVEFIDDNIKFWSNVISNIIDGVKGLINFTAELFTNIAHTIGNICNSIKNFLDEHPNFLKGLLQVGKGFLSFGIGCIKIAGSIAGAVASGGTLTVPAVLTIISGAFSVSKGVGDMFDGFCTMFDYEPPKIVRAMVAPMNVMSEFIEEALPFRHSGETVGMIGDVLDITADFISGDIVMGSIETVLLLSKGISFFCTENEMDNEVTDDVSAGVDFGSSLSDLIKNLQKIGGKVALNVAKAL